VGLLVVASIKMHTF